MSSDMDVAINACCDVVAEVLAEKITDYEGICRLMEILLPWADPRGVHSAADVGTDGVAGRGTPASNESRTERISAPSVPDASVVSMVLECAGCDTLVRPVRVPHDGRADLVCPACAHKLGVAPLLSESDAGEVRGTPAYPKVPWENAHTRPGWFFELEQAFVEAGICTWDARGKPQPQEYALVALAFIRARSWDKAVTANDVRGITAPDRLFAAIFPTIRDLEAELRKHLFPRSRIERQWLIDRIEAGDDPDDVARDFGLDPEFVREELCLDRGSSHSAGADDA